MLGFTVRLMLTVWLVGAASVAAAQNLGTVLFDFDSDRLDAEARGQIAQIVADLKANPSYLPTVVIGHTDAVGTSAYNQDLGLRRAQRVADALMAAGIPAARIATPESRGKTELVVAVATAERRNRRATVTLDDMLAACRSYRNISLNPAGFGTAFQNDLRERLETAVASHERFAANGQNGPAFQMAGAAKHDCGIAVGLAMDEERKREYGQRCFCTSARLNVALSAQ